MLSTANHQFIGVCILLSLDIAAGSLTAQCIFQDGPLAANWSVGPLIETVANGIVYVDFINRNIANGQWTGIGFGTLPNDLDAIIFTIQNFRANFTTGLLSGTGASLLQDAYPLVTPIQYFYNSNRLTARFQRQLARRSQQQVSLEGCVDWNFIASSPLSADGSVGQAVQPRTMQVCLNRCNQPQGQAMNARNYETNPVPLMALLNNRESTRFDGLYEPGGK